MWEYVSSCYLGNEKSITFRLKVPGGWVIKTEMVVTGMGYPNATSAATHQIFVADTEHTWELPKSDRDVNFELGKIDACKIGKVEVGGVPIGSITDELK